MAHLKMRARGAECGAWLTSRKRAKQHTNPTDTSQLTSRTAPIAHRVWGHSYERAEWLRSTTDPKVGASEESNLCHPKVTPHRPFGHAEVGHH